MDSDSVHPDAAAVQKRAQARTGLLDFGVPPLEVPLSVLMRSLAEEASLHRLGRFLASVHIRDLLETRLRLVESWKHWDGLEAESVRQPIFVTGMLRSGSTFLHELLSLDSSKSGMSQRQAAKVLGVSQSTVRDDVSGNHSKDEQKPLTNSASTKERRAKVAAEARDEAPPPLPLRRDAASIEAP